MPKNNATKRRQAKLRKKAEASMSAFAALNHSSRPIADAQPSQPKVEVETSRPVKKRVVLGQPQTQNPPQTQNLRTHNLTKTRSSSGLQDASSASHVQQTYVDENKQELLHKNDKIALQAVPKVTGGKTTDRDAAKPHDSLPDRIPPSLLHKVSLHSSDAEFDILYQGSNQELSTFVPSEKNVIGECAEDWTIRLQKADRLILVGQYDIWVRMGAVAVMGAVIHAGSTVHRIHAPSTHSLPVIRACYTSPFMSDDQTAEITILSISNSGICQLKEISPVFSRIWNHHSWPNERFTAKIDLSQRSFTFLKSSADDASRRPLYALEFPICWQREIDRYRDSLRTYPPPIVMVCGLKGTGKSTFCRMLANTMLSNRANSTTISYGFAKKNHLGAKGVAFLDLDPGQPEYSPSGEITLMSMRRFNLGVPYTHPIIGTSEPNRLIRAHHIGAVSANDDPQHYQRCALDLFRHYQLLLREDPSCPLVVNCSSWVTASGLEVLVELIGKISPSEIAYTQGGRSEVATILSEAADKVGAIFQPLVSKQPPILTRAASNLRMMQTLSYFHIDEPEGINLGWNRTPLSEGAPRTVRYSGVSQDIFAVMILGQEQDPDLYKYILEGSVVGVVVLQDDSAIIEVKESGQLASVGTVALEDKSATQDDGQLGRVGASLENLARRDEGHPREYRRSGESDTNSTSYEDSDAGKTQGSDASDFGQTLQQRSGKISASRKIDSQAIQPSNKVVNHPLVSRTPEGLPYVYTGARSGVQPALDPGKSYSLGQALIHGIDPESQMIYLYTPIPTSTLQSLARQERKIVLVRGNLDMPTWAFMEEYHMMATRRRQSEPGREGKGDKLLRSERREWVQRTPWAALKEERGERSSARVRHSRRNLRTG